MPFMLNIRELKMRRFCQHGRRPDVNHVDEDRFLDSNKEREAFSGRDFTQERLTPSTTV